MTATSDADGWSARGTWAWLHGLRVLDPGPDPALEAVVAVASRVIGGPVELWLRDSPGWTPGARAGGEEAPIDGVHPSVVPVIVDGLVVGELRGSYDSTPILEGVAVEAAACIARRWEERRRDVTGGPVGVLTVDDQLRVVWISPEIDELAHGEGDALLGRVALELIVDDDAAGATPLVANIAAGRGRTASVPLRLELSSHGVESFEAQAMNRSEDPEVGALSFIIRRARAASDEHTILGDQMWVLNRLSEGRPLDEVLTRVVELVERRGFDGQCCIMRVVDDMLQPVIAPGFSTDAIEALRDIRIGPDEPGGGASAHFGMPSYTNDVSHSDAFASRRAALQAEGFRACWSMPIPSMRTGGSLGSVDLYLRVAGQPIDTDTRILVTAARLAALAIDQDAHERELRYAATHDPLTGLPNRTLFAERLGDAAAQGNLGVLFIDLDRFKLVNDTLGHDFGDDLLRAVADRLAAAVSAPATVARFGGDEFTVLLPKAEETSEAVEEAERLLLEISRPYRLRGQTVAIRASAGVAVAAGPSSDPLSLVRDADAALYHAKDRGRGRVEAFDDRILVEAADRLNIERLLVEALDTGLLEVEYQPSVRVADGAIVGIEALARCRTASGDTISPVRFIPVAEETGLIGRVFDAVLLQSCHVAQAWNAGRDERLTVWVNLSPSQLGAPDLLDQVRRAFDATGVDPTTIGFEVTEQGILADPDDARDRLGALVALGAHVALDDFGTGYSSLSHLQELPVDTVKLDRSFVVRAEADARSAAIVGGVVRLAEAMGLRCVAEGVETQHELAVVEALGCDVVQGYVYCRPCAAADLTTWMATPVAPFTRGA